MNNFKEIDFDKPFVLHVEDKDGVQAYNLERWLCLEGFKFDSEKHGIYHTYILCESLTDAAKIETFIQSPK